MPAKQHPILYSFRRCPYAIRARLAVQIAGQKCQLREVTLRDKPESMLAFSPKGTVPVLILSEGQVIEESLDIMKWALGHTDPEDLLPLKAGRIEEINTLIHRNDNAFKTHLDRYKYSDRYPDETMEVYREQASVFMRELNQRLEKSAWLLGDHKSLADIAIAPFVRQFANTDRTWFDLEPWPHLRTWLEDFLDSSLFAAVMSKRTAWQAGDETTVFPSSKMASWSRSFG